MLILLATQFLRIFRIFFIYKFYQTRACRISRTLTYDNSRFSKVRPVCARRTQNTKITIFFKNEHYCKCVGNDLEVGIEKDPLGSSETEPQVSIRNWVSLIRITNETIDVCLQTCSDSSNRCICSCRFPAIERRLQQ